MDDFMDSVGSIRIPVFVYWLLLAVCLCGGAYLFSRYGKKQKYQPTTAWVYLISAVPLALFFGRLIYTAIRYDWIFFDGMGSFQGLLPFFNPSQGGMNAVGILIGCLIAGFNHCGNYQTICGKDSGRCCTLCNAPVRVDALRRADCKSGIWRLDCAALAAVLSIWYSQRLGRMADARLRG